MYTSNKIYINNLISFLITLLITSLLTKYNQKIQKKHFLPFLTYLRCSRDYRRIQLSASTWKGTLPSRIFRKSPWPSFVFHASRDRILVDPYFPPFSPHLLLPLLLFPDVPQPFPPPLTASSLAVSSFSNDVSPICSVSPSLLLSSMILQFPPRLSQNLDDLMLGKCGGSRLDQLESPFARRACSERSSPSLTKQQMIVFRNVDQVKGSFFVSRVIYLSTGPEFCTRICGSWPKLHPCTFFHRTPRCCNPDILSELWIWKTGVENQSYEK